MLPYSEDSPFLVPRMAILWDSDCGISAISSALAQSYQLPMMEAAAVISSSHTKTEPHAEQDGGGVRCAEHLSFAKHPALGALL